MPVSPNNYNHRGKGNYGIIVRCPNIEGDRLVYFDHNARRGSWVIRDFITRQQLSNNTSPLTVAQIEADTNYDEFPPWRHVRNTDDWDVYLRLRTTAVFGVRAPSLATPNAQSGRWLQI